MSRHTNADLRKDWKLSLSATLAGAVEWELMDPVTGKPRYAERSRLISALLAAWLAERGKRLPGGADLPSADLITDSMRKGLANDEHANDPVLENILGAGHSHPSRRA